MNQAELFSVSFVALKAMTEQEFTVYQTRQAYFLEQATKGAPARVAREVPEFLANLGQDISDRVKAVRNDLLKHLIENVTSKRIVTDGIGKDKLIYPRWRSLTFGDIRLMVGFDEKVVKGAYQAQVKALEAEAQVLAEAKAQVLAEPEISKVKGKKLDF